jgi:hypothetical protein
VSALDSEGDETTEADSSAARDVEPPHPLTVTMPLVVLLAVVLTFLAMAAAPASAEPFGPPQSLFVLSTTFLSPLRFAAAGDVAGNGIAVVRDESRGSIPLIIERRHGGAWSQPAPLAGVAASVVVAAAGDGAAAIVWRQDAPSRNSAIKALVRAPGGSFEGPFVVAGPGLDGVRAPRVAVAANGAAVVAFHAGIGRRTRRLARVAVAVRAAGERQFSRPALVTRTPAGPPAVAMSADGHGIVAWLRDGRIEAVGIEGGRLGTVRTIADEAWGPPSVAIADHGDAVVVWTKRGARLPSPYRTPAADTFAAVRRGPTGFGPARRLVTADFDFVRAAAAGPAGRFVVAWIQPDLRTGQSRARAVTAAPGERRFGRPYDLYRYDGGAARALALAGTPRGFVAIWPPAGDATSSVWRASMAGDDGRLVDAGTLGSPSPGNLSAYARTVSAFGDRFGHVTALWVQPPQTAPTPPPPPTPGAPPPAPPAPISFDFTLQAADASLPHATRRASPGPAHSPVALAAARTL